MDEADVDVLAQAREWLRVQLEERPKCADCDGHGRRDCERCGAFVDSEGPRIVESLLEHVAGLKAKLPSKQETQLLQLLRSGVVESLEFGNFTIKRRKARR